MKYICRINKYRSKISTSDQTLITFLWGFEICLLNNARLHLPFFSKLPFFVDGCLETRSLLVMVIPILLVTLSLSSVMVGIYEDQIIIICFVCVCVCVCACLDKEAVQTLESRIRSERTSCGEQVRYLITAKFIHYWKKWIFL